MPGANESTPLSRLLNRFNLRNVFLPPPPLIDRGSGLIYDTERDITWLQDVNYAKTARRSPDGQLTWPQAMAWVAGLTYRGIGGWRLPTAKSPDGSGPAIGNGCAGSEMGHLFLGVFSEHPNIVQFTNFTARCIYWTSTEANAEEAYALEVETLRQGTLWKDPFAERFPSVPLPGPVLAWPVHDGDVAAELRSRWDPQHFLVRPRIVLSRLGQFLTGYLIGRDLQRVAVRIAEVNRVRNLVILEFEFDTALFQFALRGQKIFAVRAKSEVKHSKFAVT
jgi:hypothetical protein